MQVALLLPKTELLFDEELPQMKKYFVDFFHHIIHARMLYFDVKIFDQNTFSLSSGWAGGGLTMRNVRSQRQPKILNDPLAAENWATHPSWRKLQEIRINAADAFSA